MPCFWTTVCATLTPTMTDNHVVPGVPEVKEDSVSKILERRGIKYSHRNDDILVPNTIEEQQMKKARKVRSSDFAHPRSALIGSKQERRQQKRKAKEPATFTEPEFNWPPKRVHHKRPPSPGTKYVDSKRILCLV